MSDATEVRTASSTGGEKGVKLARYELIPVGPLEELASRFGLGAMKYENRNWERGYEWHKSFGALMRHAQAFWGGQDDDDLGDEAYRAAGLDPKEFKEIYGRIPGSSHLAAVAFHALALLEWMSTHPEFDDRVKPKRDEWAPDPKTESMIRNEALKRATAMRRRERITAAAKELDAELTEDAKALATGMSVDDLLQMQDGINKAVANQMTHQAMPDLYPLPVPLPSGFLKEFGYSKVKVSDEALLDEPLLGPGVKGIVEAAARADADRPKVVGYSLREREAELWNALPKPWEKGLDQTHPFE